MSDQPAQDAPETGTDDTPAIDYNVQETTPQPGSVLRYRVEVAREVFDEKLADIFKQLAKTVAIEGFRRGKAPVSLLRKRFGKEAQSDAVNEMAQNVGRSIAEKDELDAIGEPALADSKVEDGKPVELQIDIEVEPKIEVTGHQGETYEVEPAPALGEMVDNQLEEIRNANANYDEARPEGEPFQEGDGALLDIEAVDQDGNRMESLCQTESLIREPARQLMPEVAESLVGKKPGETWTVEVEREVAGETHKDSFTLTLREVRLRKLPELDDDFAREVGEFESLADLRERIEKDLGQQAEDRKRQALMDQVLERLMEKNSFDAPRTYVAQQQYQTIMRDTQQLQQMGLSLEAMGMSTESYVERSREQAERFVKAQLLLQAIARQEKIEVTDEDLDKEIERQAEQAGRKPLAIRARLEAEGRLETLRSSLMTGKVEDYLTEHNEIKEVAPAADDKQ